MSRMRGLMLQRLYGQLPDFARPSHPVMRYLLLREGRRVTRSSQTLRVIGSLFLIGLLLLVGWLIATEFGRTPIDTSNPLDGVYLVFYWPLVALQVLIRIFAMGSTVGVIASEERHGTWDTLKITTEGALLTMKARWATAFYRLWLLLAVLVITRVVFIVIALIDLSSFQGRYLDLLLSGTIPFGPPSVANDASVVMGVVVVAVSMTAALLAPFTALALDASFGMLVGTIARGRVSSSLFQAGLIGVRLLITAWALWVGASALSLTPFANLTTAFNPTSGQAVMGWLGAFFGIAEGDLGLTLLHLPYVQRMWADHDYGILVGVACLGWVLLQALVANFLIHWAGRRAVQAERL